MDKFAIDLDKVLDEFEKSEEQIDSPWIGSSSPSLQNSQSSLNTFIHNLDPVASQPSHSKDVNPSALLSPSFESLFVNPRRKEEPLPQESAVSISLSNGHISLPPSEETILTENLDTGKDVSNKPRSSSLLVPIHSSFSPEGLEGRDLSHKYSATLEANLDAPSPHPPDLKKDVDLSSEQNADSLLINDSCKKPQEEASKVSSPSQECLGDKDFTDKSKNYTVSQTTGSYDHISELPSELMASSSSENILNMSHISYSTVSIVSHNDGHSRAEPDEATSEPNLSRADTTSLPLIREESTIAETDSQIFTKDFIAQPEHPPTTTLLSLEPSSPNLTPENLSKSEPPSPATKDPSGIVSASSNEDFDFIKSSPHSQASHDSPGQLLLISNPSSCDPLAPSLEINSNKDEMEPNYEQKEASPCTEENSSFDESPMSEAQQASNLESADSEIREHTLLISKSKDKLCKEEWRPEMKSNEEYEDPLEQGDQPVRFHKFHEEDFSPESMAELENYLSKSDHSLLQNSKCHEEGSFMVTPALVDKEHNGINESNIEDEQGKSESPCLQEDSSPSDEEASPDVSTDETPSPAKEIFTESYDNEMNASSVQQPVLEASMCNGIAAHMETPPRLSRPNSLNLPREPQAELHQLGRVKPIWVPDADAPNCMLCNAKFTVIKRRHHCRTCGKVLCSQCCNQRVKLEFLQNKEGRVCHPCYLLLSEGPSAVEAGGINSPGMTPYHGWSPNPNHPQEYCSTLPPHQQVENQPPPTVMVPVGVLKNSSSNVNARGAQNHLEPKQVMFSDGIRPGGDLQDLTVSAPPAPRGPVTRSPTILTSPSEDQPPTRAATRGRRTLASDDEGPLPPLILPPDTPASFKPNTDELLSYLKDKKAKPLRFALTKNLHVDVKLVTLSCCVGSECWSFASRGLCAVGQDEILLVLEQQQGEEERAIPRCAFRLLHRLWDDAQRGQPASDLGHVLFPEGLFGSREHSGFLLVRPTFQCLGNLWPPPAPFLLALLLQRWEVPWAKVFPLRLMLRLGSEARYYPCPIVSQRGRRPVYGEVGHTILSVLADLRNFQFTLPTVPGVTVHMNSGGATTVRLPRNRWEAVRRWLVAANEHVLALGANFSTIADSHLVCVQREEDGSYHTQAINIQNTPRKVTGASFIVFSGALKVSSGALSNTSDSSGQKIYPAKCSLVEDGLLVQMSSETLGALRSALRDMRNFTLTCGSGGPDNSETVDLVWVEDDRTVNIGVRSPIDGKSLSGVESVRIHTATDYMAHRLAIRWTEVFFCREGEESALPPPTTRSEEPLDPGRVAEAAAEAFCRAVTPHLPALAAVAGGVGTNRIGLRLALGGELVEFEAGTNCHPLPASILPALDSVLIPLIHSSGGPPLVLELHFHLLYK